MMTFWKGKQITVLLIMFLALPSGVFASSADLLIVEVQIAGEKADHDFIKIYNPADTDVYLGNYQGSYIRLVRRTKTATKDEPIKSWSQEADIKIPAKGYYIWASSYDETYPALLNANVSTKKRLTADNGIALRLGPLDTGAIIDAVGWGDFNNVLLKGASFPQNPEANQVLARKQGAGVYQNTNNNAEDFYLDPLLQAEEPAASDSTGNPTDEETKTEPPADPQESTAANTESSAAPATQPVATTTVEQKSFKVDINTAPAEDLVKIMHISEGRAQELISLRPFYSLEELVRIRGISAKSIEDIKAQGLAWVDPALKTATLSQQNQKKQTESAKSLFPGKIDINAASLEDLMKIVHIGPARAEELISLRPFYSLDDLTRIRGIGDKAVEDIKKQGMAWIDPVLEQDETEKEAKVLAALTQPREQSSERRQIPNGFIILLSAVGIAIFSAMAAVALKRNFIKLL